MAVDGPNNSVAECVPAPVGEDNPYGNSFTVTWATLRTEKEARRGANPGPTRRVSNPGKINEICRSQWVTSLCHFFPSVVLSCCC